ncbi:uncharacterized protein LOC135366265 [Ornithodoros turicata]|uniref:uncharacterized protein LOC135366265 n=1 Tax=Ornithodoros turicata TaxID=34597 RepID=UPI0031396C7A
MDDKKVVDPDAPKKSHRNKSAASSRRHEHGSELSPIAKHGLGNKASAGHKETKGSKDNLSPHGSKKSAREEKPRRRTTESTKNKKTTLPPQSKGPSQVQPEPPNKGDEPPNKGDEPPNKGDEPPNKGDEPSVQPIPELELPSPLRVLSEQIDLLNLEHPNTNPPQGPPQDITKKPDMQTHHKHKETKTSGSRNLPKSARKSTSLMLTAAILVILLIVVIALTSLLVYKHYKTQQRLKTMECKTTVCKRVQGEIDDLLDKNTDPCNDFHGYVCRKWTRQSHNSTTGFIQDVIDIYHHTLVSALESPETRQPDKFGLHAMTKLFGVCVDYMTKDKGTFTDAVGKVIDLLKLDMIIDRKQRLLPFLVESSLSRNIHSVFVVQFRRIGNFRYVEIEYGDTIRSKMTDVVPTSLTGGTSFENMIGTVMKNMTSEFLEHPRVNSDIDPDKLLRADSDIAQLLGATPSVTYATFGEVTGFLSPEGMKDFVEVINKYAPPEFQVGLSSTARFSGVQTLRAVNALLVNQSAGVREAYHMLNIATSLLRCTAFKDVAQSSPAIVPYTCLRATRIAFTNTWPLLIARLIGDPRRGTAARKLATRVRDMVLEETVFENFTSLDRERGKAFLRKTQSVTFDSSRAARITEYSDYTTWNLQGNHPFEVFVEAGQKESIMLRRAFSLEILVKASLIQVNPHIAYYKIESSTETGTRRYVMVPTAYQIPPLLYFEEMNEIPLYINMATIGALVAKEMVRSLASSFKSSKSTKALHESLKCVKEVAVAQGVRFEDGGDLWENEVVLRYYGFRIVYEGLRRVLLSLGESTTGDIWKEAQRYLFVRFCMLACASDSPSTRLIFKKYCLVTVLSNPDFATAFDCTGNTVFKADNC